MLLLGLLWLIGTLMVVLAAWSTGSVFPAVLVVLLQVGALLAGWAYARNAIRRGWLDRPQKPWRLPWLVVLLVAVVGSAALISGQHLAHSTLAYLVLAMCAAFLGFVTAATFTMRRTGWRPPAPDKL